MAPRIHFRLVIFLYRLHLQSIFAVYVLTERNKLTKPLARLIFRWYELKGYVVPHIQSLVYRSSCCDLNIQKRWHYPSFLQGVLPAYSRQPFPVLTRPSRISLAVITVFYSVWCDFIFLTPYGTVQHWRMDELYGKKACIQMCLPLRFRHHSLA